MWRALDTFDRPVRRTWERRIAAGVAPVCLDPVTARRMVWTGWPGCVSAR
jgi:hypothetical protein